MSDRSFLNGTRAREGEIVLADSASEFVAPEFHEISDVVRMSLAWMLMCDPEAGLFARIYLAKSDKPVDKAAMELSGLLILARLTVCDDALGHA